MAWRCLSWWWRGLGRRKSLLERPDQIEVAFRTVWAKVNLGATFSRPPYARKSDCWWLRSVRGPRWRFSIRPGRDSRMQWRRAKPMMTSLTAYWMKLFQFNRSGANNLKYLLKAYQFLAGQEGMGKPVGSGNCPAEYFCSSCSKLDHEKIFLTLKITNETWRKWQDLLDMRWRNVVGMVFSRTPLEDQVG